MLSFYDSYWEIKTLLSQQLFIGNKDDDEDDLAFDKAISAPWGARKVFKRDNCMNSILELIIFIGSEFSNGAKGQNM